MLAGFLKRAAPIDGMTVGRNMIAHGLTKNAIIFNQQNAHTASEAEPKARFLQVEPDNSLNHSDRWKRLWGNCDIYTAQRVFRLPSAFSVSFSASESTDGERDMKTFILSTLVLGLAGPAFAADKCDVPTDQWQPREALQKKLESEGWKVRSIKTENGCYEAKAVDANGKRLEGVFNPKTLESVGADSDDG